MLFYNGRILKSANDLEVQDVGSLSVREGKISQSGLDPENQIRIDLQGQTLLPGFIDTHMHLLNYGLYLKSVDVAGCDSITELVQRLQVRVQQTEPGVLIVGRGWDENRYGGILPTRADLDKVSPDNPVVLSRVCGHLIVVNSKTLEMMSIKDSTPCPEGGAIDFDELGHLTGVFRENAMALIFDNLPESTLEDVEEALIAGGRGVLSQGITTVHTDDLGGYDDIQPMIQLYRRLYLEGKLPKTHMHIKPEQLKQAVELGYKTGTKLDGITIGAVKIFTDGSLGARTAALCEEYSDAAGQKGILCYSDTELYKIIKEAHGADFAVAIHGIGDAATAQAVRIIARVQEENPKYYLRHCLIHAQILTEEIMETMLKYGILAEIQPIFINTDLHWAESRVGQRIKTSYNWQTLWEKGIKISGSSDCPVEPVNPLWGIYSAVTRKDLAGNPPGGWYPEEALTFNQALQLFTVCGAYAGAEENEKGIIAEGMSADLVVLDRPIDSISADEIKDIQIVMTIINGKIVYQK